MGRGLSIACGFALLAAGCASAPRVAENPVCFPEPQGGYEQAWNETVRVVGRHFPVVREQRYNGVLESSNETSGGLLEPWRRDTATLRDRVEASLQTVRRRCIVRLQPLAAGGYSATVEVHKELEQLPQPIFTNFGGTTLLHALQPVRESTMDQNAPVSAGWIPRGRDPVMEALIVADLKHALGSISSGSFAEAAPAGNLSGPQMPLGAEAAPLGIENPVPIAIPPAPALETVVPPN